MFDRILTMPPSSAINCLGKLRLLKFDLVAIDI